VTDDTFLTFVPGADKSLVRPPRRSLIKFTS